MHDIKLNLANFAITHRDLFHPDDIISCYAAHPSSALPPLPFSAVPSVLSHRTDPCNVCSLLDCITGGCPFVMTAEFGLQIRIMYVLSVAYLLCACFKACCYTTYMTTH